VPLPRWSDVRKFCLEHHYAESKTDHYHYLKVLTDGTTSGTMISFGDENAVVERNRWAMVWRRQLRLASEEDFWRGLRGEPFRYAIPPPSEPIQPLPEYLVRFLRDTLHWSEEQIARTTRAAAQEYLNAYYAGELRED
jgi:hypothetical protein